MSSRMCLWAARIPARVADLEYQKTTRQSEDLSEILQFSISPFDNPCLFFDFSRLDLLINPLWQVVGLAAQKIKKRLGWGMVKIKYVRFSGVKRVSKYIDPTSTVSQRDHSRSNNAYQNVRRLLTDKGDWLAPLSKMALVVILDAAGKEITREDFAHYIMGAEEDEFGRKRSHAAYHGIWNPPDDVQVLLRYVSQCSAPLFVKIVKELFEANYQWVRTWACAAPVELAFHCVTGRLHFEWLVPKYDARGKRIGRGLDWDSAQTSASHVTHWAKTQGLPPKLKPNSLHSLQMAARVYQRVRTLIESKELPLPKTAFIEGRRFFKLLQLASLKDRLRSRSRRTSRKAIEELERKRSIATKIISTPGPYGRGKR